MARLTKAQRDRLTANAFAYPKQRAYPICDEKHAKAALIMSARSDTFGTLAHVKAKVKRRYPHLVKGS